MALLSFNDDLVTRTKSDVAKKIGGTGRKGISFGPNFQNKHQDFGSGFGLEAPT